MADPARDVKQENDEDMEEEEEVESGNNELDDTEEPTALAALKSTSIPESYPPSVKRRINALRRLQLKATKIESQFYAEVHALECKYFKEHYQPLLDKRRKITSGEYEPTDEECVWSSDEDEKDEKEKICSEMNKVKIKEEDAKENENQKNDNVKGIPDFWLTIFKTVGMLAEMVQEHDEPILKHLVDVKVIFSEKPMGFTLEFHFSPNEYFNNSVLTKEYEMTCVPDESDPFSFEGPEIYKCKGCTIDWKKGKNVTVKVIKKKQKHKSRGSLRTVTKTVQNDSFFNFFNPPTVAEDHEGELDREVQALLTSDFEIGHYIRERIVPRAVLYYTGEALDEDEDYDEDDGDEYEESDEDDDPDFNPCKPNNLAQRPNPENCNQQ
ncbi:hypothetical protein J437_LFUL015725 [Ladona fulva]|uniref:Nucleosome assembly protein 1-like 4 n=1 Tax=Ladona fulva TaxID=123851 RepID=A0A8K0KNK5_LADFU|nr:hypothetical protein J437_LFUL015725 [Ladona fulva]